MTGAVPNEARMLRVTASNLGTIMTRWMADQVFVSHDDIVTSRPRDRTLPPLQQYSSSRGADGEWGVAGVDDNGNGITDGGDGAEGGVGVGDDIAVQRQTEGELSWIATLAPALEDTAIGRLYTLSIVVIENRPRPVVARGTDLGLGPAAGNETVFQVEAFIGQPALFGKFNAPNGGLVRLRTTLGEADKESLTDLREGDWLMLGGFLESSPVFRWYRVIRADNDVVPTVVSGVTQYLKNVTLDGPDFPYVRSGASTRVQATFVGGVIGVYEKNVSLESLSIWN